jgi:hypothetical protein
MFKVHENQNYMVVVGIPPSTPDMPNPINAYLIVNKETGVTESWHGILFYATQNADLFNDMLVNPPKKEDGKQESKKPGFSFN